jgi:glycosyltransferase involved in cell wall biosynthesis
VSCSPGSSPLTVAVSLFANDRGRSGIGRYMASILPALFAADPRVAWRLFVAREDRGVFSSALPADDPRITVVEVDDAWNAPAASLVWHALRLPFAAHEAGADVIYLPAGNRRLAPFGGIPSVAVVHDLSSFHVRGKYDALRNVYVTRVMPWLIRHSTRVITISTSSAYDIVTLAHYPQDRLTIVGNGYDRALFHPRPAAEARAALAAAGLGLPHRYLLYVSRLEHPGKNHVGLLEAYRRVLDGDSAFPDHLVFAGGRWNGAEAVDEAIARLGLASRVHLLGFVPDGALPPLYAAARAFVFPSLFEGFGIPLIEAQASGIPVAGAAVSSIPEVLGDSGLLFDPHDEGAIADALVRISRDETLRAGLVERGEVNIRRFTWEHAAQCTLDVLREAAGDRRQARHVPNRA